MDSKVGRKKSPKNRPPLEAPLGRLLAPSADILFRKVVRKGAKRRPKEGSQTELNPGPQKKKEKVSSTQYLLCFSHVDRSKKDHLLCSCWETSTEEWRSCRGHCFDSYHLDHEYGYLRQRGVTWCAAAVCSAMASLGVASCR